jgi:hypothetical protein
MIGDYYRSGGFETYALCDLFPDDHSPYVRFIIRNIDGMD